MQMRCDQDAERRIQKIKVRPKCMAKIRVFAQTPPFGHLYQILHAG